MVKEESGGLDLDFNGLDISSAHLTDLQNLTSIMEIRFATKQSFKLLEVKDEVIKF